MPDQYTDLPTIRDHVTQARIIDDIIMLADKKSALLNCPAVKTYSVPDGQLRGRIPIMSTIEGHRNVGELEESELKKVIYTHFEFALEKDRVKFGFSDEVQMDQMVGNTVNDTKAQAALRLSTMMEQRLAEQFAKTPQTVTFDTSDPSNFATDVAPRVIDALLPYGISTVCTSRATLQKFWGVLNDGYSGYANFATQNTIPVGSGVGITLSDHLGDNKMYFATGEIPAVGVVKGDVRSRTHDSFDKGGILFQIDEWRQAFSNVVTVVPAGGTAKNKGVVEVTLS